MFFKKLNHSLLAILLITSSTLFPSLRNGTLVLTPKGHIAIETLNIGDTIILLDDSGNEVHARINHITTKQSESYYEIKTPTTNIYASANQLFYNAHTKSWVPTKNLSSDNEVACFNLATERPLSIQKIDAPCTFYTLSLDYPHTFYITKSNVLVHNFIPFIIGISIAFGDGIIVTGCGAGLGALGGLGIWHHFKNRKNNYGYHDELIFKNTSDAQAPGMPTENDGFIPPKNWDGKKVKHRKGYGYPDKNGNIWIPSGPNGHGGPHWDVQYPKGKGYDNILPGGKIRGQK